MSLAGDGERGGQPACGGEPASFTEHSCAGPDDPRVEQIKPNAGKSRSALIGHQPEYGAHVMNRKLLLTLLGASAALVMAVGTTQAAPASSAGDALRSA